MVSERKLWRLRRRPQGAIREGDLEFLTEPLPELKDGEFLLEVLYLSLDPTNRIWMSDMRQYMPPVALDDPMRGGVAGRVRASRKAGVSEGEIWFGLGQWADHIVTDGSGYVKAQVPSGLPLSVAYGVFGLVGPTAYFGLLEIGQPKAGDTLVVSAASGGVGQVVGQIGKIKGCRVIGIAGGPDKCRTLVEEYGFDAAIDYKNEDVAARLDELAPKGVDINFEQVGGPIMGSRHEPHGAVRPHAALRHDLRLQRRGAGRRTQHVSLDPDGAHQGAGFHRLRFPEEIPGDDARARRLDHRGPHQDHAGRASRPGQGARLSRPALHRRQQGQAALRSLARRGRAVTGAAERTPIWFGTVSLQTAHFGAPGLVEHLGIELLEFGDDWISGRMPVDERTKQPFGLLHGGASVVLAESLALLRRLRLRRPRTEGVRRARDQRQPSAQRALGLGDRHGAADPPRTHHTGLGHSYLRRGRPADLHSALHGGRDR